MADKSFGVDQLDILGTGTPTISAPNQLNLDCNTVAISTSATVGQNLTVSANAGIASLNVTGIATVVNFNATGISTIAVPSNTNANSALLVTANGSSAYRFTGPGQDGSDDNPNIYLVRGQRYIFTNNSGGSHPFQIRVASGGAAYSTGVTNNGASSGNIIFNVQHDAPAQLYYQCTSHGSMVGNIYIVGGPQVISGVVTATSFSGAVSGTTGTFTGDVDIADTIVHTGDTNTKIRFPAADTITAETGGSERVRIDSTGRVLVNTTTTNNGNNKMIIEGPSPSGTYAAYDGQLVLQNSETSGAINTGSALVFFGHDGGNQRGSGAIRCLKENGTSGNHNFYMSFLTRVDGGSNTEKLRIASNGHVAIGTDSPNSALPLTIAGQYPGIQFKDNQGTTDFNINADSAAFRIQSGTAGAGPSEKFRIGSSGQIGLSGANYGSSGQVLTSQGSGSAPIWSTAASGKVLKFTAGGSTSEYNCNNSNFQNTHSVSHTPVSSTSKFIILYMPVRMVLGGSTNGYVRCRDGSGSTSDNMLRIQYLGSGGKSPHMQFYMPTSRTAGSSTTFTIQGRDASGSNDDLILGDNGTKSTLIVVEIEV